MKIYLACPFSHKYFLVRLWRYYKVTRRAAKLMDEGHIVFSPLTHSWPVSLFTKADDQDHHYWMKQDLTLIEWCDLFYIYALKGWSKSRGISEELLYAGKLNKEIQIEGD